MNQERGDENLGNFQVILGIYNPATTVLGLLGGFVYTSIVAISLSKDAHELKGIVTLLLFAFLSLLAAFSCWQLGALDFTRLRAESGLIPYGNSSLLIGIALILGSLFWLVTVKTGWSIWNVAWLILSCSGLVVAGWKLRQVLERCRPVA